MAKTISLIAANVWCWGWLIIVSMATLLVAPLWLLTAKPRGWSLARVIREGAWLYGWVYLACIRPFVRVEVVNPHLVKEHSPVIMAGNHQSWLDLMLLATQKERNFCILVGTWPFKRLFFFGPLIKLARNVTTEGVAADEILRQCHREVATGACILGYPEGTRSFDGSLGRFHSGLFKLAVELNLPVVPVIVKNSRRIISKGSLIFRPGCIKIIFEPPIGSQMFAGEPIPHRALSKYVRQRFLKALTIAPPQ
ncbi:MAG: 1-acyl-sn-glycerol-3-phosphate acyltransferase [Deltaproteobacteria bacterium]|jgi:1-acyl-sn-glycerol-3-phosphate acyltransferase|nr:1-acyl-sn-glycerol-3-phosphate acyltransferase [Deltaproteobacteria bacterium]